MDYSKLYSRFCYRFICLSFFSKTSLAINYLYNGVCNKVYLWTSKKVIDFISLMIKKYIFYLILSNSYNLNPKMRALQTQPTVSPTLIHHIQRKHITIKPDIKVF